MKKALLAAGLAMLLSVPAWAADPSTMSEKLDRIDEVVYGRVQTGSLIGRTDGIDNIIYGKGNTTANGLDARVDNLYTDVVKGVSDTAPSMYTRTNALEYYLSDEIRQDALNTRIGELETLVYGQEKKGALDSRIAGLEKSVYGDQHFEMKAVELPADTVFKISLNEDVSSKTNQVGDDVHFTVAEDVMVGDVLVLPKGAQGSGVVTKVSRPQSFGRSGTLDISFDQVFSVDDEAIPTVLGPESKEKIKMEAAAVGASAIGALALGPLGLVGGIFVKGKDVEMPAGTPLYIQTQQAVQTKGIELTDGAPTITLRSRIKRENASADAVQETAEAPKTAAESAAETPKEKAESAAEAPAENMNEDAKAELENVREKGDVKTESAAAEQADSQDTSVVIVRHE